MIELADEELIKKISMGDRVAFATLLEKYKSMVFGFSVRILNDKILAEEISQETWMRVIEKSDQFQGKSKVSTWILSITKNLALDVLRQNSRWDVEQDITDLNTDGSVNGESENKAEYFLEKDFLQSSGGELSTAESKMLLEQDLEILKQKISKLPDKQRTAIVLTLTDEDASQTDLALQMGISVNAFKVLIFKAKENLKKLWSDNGSINQKGEIDE